MFDTLSKEQIELGLPVQDDFQRAMILGKQIALSWVLGETPGAVLGTHFNREDWGREVEERRFTERAPAVED